MSRRPQVLPARQRGVALITAMLVVALATILAVSLTHEQELALRRSANLQSGAQAWEYALGLERLARNRLHEDLVSGRRVDTLTDPWALRLGPLPVPGGMLTGRMEDLDGRFNVNSLLAPPPLGELQVQRFRNLLSVLELDPSLADRVVDWLDADREPRPAGAETAAYARMEPPYAPGNRPLAHASELRLVLGVDAEAWRRLAPHVAALPDVEAGINVNTAPPAVLRALSPGLGAEAAEELARAGRDGFATVNEFLDHRLMRELTVPAAGLSVRSTFFLAHGVVELDDDVFHFFSVIRRGDAEGMSVLRRSRGVE